MLHGVQFCGIRVHVLFLGVHVSLSHLLAYVVMLSVQVADTIHGARLAAPWVGASLRINAHVLHGAAT